ncbi:MAG: hypothetical protein MMC23_000966 [Stictis urceolatum]|nr:hypothetical protein [Stictis urceolata]
MGRRKIEIKAIKDDRNRSVTFLKRKGGLFKKAHELSVLCSVDVAVIIFGHNKKLYEYSSGDINETIGRHAYYGGAHEHKGPADFTGKRDDDDEDDEDVDEAAIQETMGAAEQHLPPHLQNQPGFAHMRHAPSSSPPVGNGAMPYHPRGHTPQPPQMGSRPSSRNAHSIQRPRSTLGQHQVGHGPPMPNGYPYMQQQQQGPYGPPQQQPQHPMPMPHPGQQPQPHPQFQYPQQPQHQMQHPYMQEQRRQGSMPPQFGPTERPPHQQQPPQPQPQPQHQRLHQPHPHPQHQQPQPPPQQLLQPQPPQPPPQTRQSPSPQQQPPEFRTDHLQPQQPKPLSVKSKSIYTPIDDSRSMLAGGWDFSSSRNEARPEHIKQEKDTRSQSVDVASVNRNHSQSGPTMPPELPQRTFTQPQRTQSTASLGGDKGRPRLKVQIPSEHSDEEDGPNASTSPKQSTGPSTSTHGTPLKTEHTGSGVVLPPPSPSASALLSAGAQGPPNPFARPLPPGAGGPGGANTTAYNNNNNQSIETPMSALPSRFVADQFLPSPSSFYPEWGFGGGRSAEGGNMLPSPLNFQTPVQGSSMGFGAQEEEQRKRKGSDEGEAVGQGQGQGQGEAKRVKA